MVALIDRPANARAFEALDGLLTVTSAFKCRSTPREVKLKLVEFLYFYLTPETPSIPRAAAPGALLHRSPSKLAKAFGASSTPSHARGRRAAPGADGTRTTDEKQALLARHLNNDTVEDLVRDLATCMPFGGAVC